MAKGKTNSMCRNKLVAGMFRTRSINTKPIINTTRRGKSRVEINVQWYDCTFCDRYIDMVIALSFVPLIDHRDKWHIHLYSPSMCLLQRKWSNPMKNGWMREYYHYNPHVASINIGEYVYQTNRLESFYGKQDMKHHAMRLKIVEYADVLEENLHRYSDHRIRVQVQHNEEYWN